MKIYFSVIALLLTMLVWGQSVLVNYNLILGVVTIAVVAGNLFWSKKHLVDKEYKGLISLSGVYIILELLWLVLDEVALWVLGQGTLIVLIVGLFVLSLFTLNKKTSNSHFLLNIFKGSGVIFLTSISTFLLYSSVNPSLFIAYFQNVASAKNIFEPQTEFSTTASEGNKLVSDIEYGTTYPNSYLDILTPDGSVDLSRPTYFFIHGGGFVAGDKMQGDPNQVSEYSASLYHFEKMVESGYNVVTVNYAFAPEHPYPTQLIQLSEAIRFLQDNGEEYGISMDNVVFSGSSAGGNLAADFVTIQANPDHAEFIGIKPVISLDKIKALVLEVPVLDFNKGSKTVEEDKFNDYIFGQSISAYLEQPLIGSDRELLAQRSVISKVTSNFPPVFITDGNTGSFRNQAEDYYKNLIEQGVEAELYVPDLSESAEGHGYLAEIYSKATQTYIEKKLSFLQSLD